MQSMVPLYGFGGGGGGSGCTLTVTAPAGVTVTVSKDGKSKTKVSDSSGMAVFKGLSTGDWTVVISDGSQTSAPKTVTITADYETAITFFSATIHVTYPADSTCTATDGVTTLTAPDTSGTWACAVPNAGTWIISVVDKGWNESVSITENGQSEQVYLNYVYLFKDGNSYESLTGGFGKSGYMYYASSYTLYGPTITESINVSVSKASAACIGGTQKAIDVTNFNELSADCISASGSGSSFVANLVVTDSARDVQSSRALAYAGLSSGQTATIDLSGVSGSVYIAVVVAGSSASPSVSAVVNNIKLA